MSAMYGGQELIEDKSCFRAQVSIKLFVAQNCKNTNKTHEQVSYMIYAVSRESCGTSNFTDFINNHSD